MEKVAYTSLIIGAMIASAMTQESSNPSVIAEFFNMVLIK